MSDQFYMMLGVVLPVLIVQGFQYLATRKNARKSEADRDEIKSEVGKVRDHLNTVSMSREETSLLIAGAERQNVAKGIEIGKQQATGSMQIGK